MDVLKQAIQLIVHAAERVDVGTVHALLIMYMAATAALLLIRILKGVRR